MQNLKTAILFVLAGSLLSCKLIRKDDEIKPVARVFDSYLYEDEIQGLTNGLNAQDSAAFIENYIYSWGKEQLLIHRAEFNLAESQKDFEELVMQYRNDLLKFAYLEKYVNEHLDTVISDELIQTYYLEHSADFELKENILKAEYFVFDNETKELDKAKSWWRSVSEKNTERFLEYASIFAKEKSVGDTNWVRYNELSMRIPLQTYNQLSVLNNNKRLFLEDSINTYFVSIKAFKIKDDVSPLPYVSKTVKSIILNKRKLELIAKMEASLVKDAYDKKNFEIYK